jgi:hypothetical protein
MTTMKFISSGTRRRNDTDAASTFHGNATNTVRYSGHKVAAESRANGSWRSPATCHVAHREVRIQHDVLIANISLKSLA